jgi:hypothetical protein
LVVPERVDQRVDERVEPALFEVGSQIAPYCEGRRPGCPCVFASRLPWLYAGRCQLPPMLRSTTI